MSFLYLSSKIRAVALALVWAVMAIFLSTGAHADEGPHSHGETGHGAIVVEDSFLRTNGATGKTGAAFLTIVNTTDADDRLVSVESAVANMTEMHTHLEDANGVMMMRPVENGFVVPANGTHTLKRGGDHLMMMGINAELAQDDLVTFILTFENAGPVVVVMPVDQDRKN